MKFLISTLLFFGIVSCSTHVSKNERTPSSDVLKVSTGVVAAPFLVSGYSSAITSGLEFHDVDVIALKSDAANFLAHDQMSNALSEMLQRIKKESPYQKATEKELAALILLSNSAEGK